MACAMQHKQQLQYTVHYKKFVTHSMSLSWQNRRHGQSLVANGKSKV